MDMDFSLFRQIADNIQDEHNVMARFYDKAVKTSKVSDNGVPIFKNVTYVEIRLKDNNTEVFNQPASAEKIRRFPKEYALYQMSKEKIKDGTPLEQFAFLTAAEVATCKNRGIFTVEDLAALDNEKVQKLNLEDEHQLAKVFIKNANNNGKIADFVAREKEYRQQIKMLREKIENLEKQLQQKKNFKGKHYKKENNNENHSGNMS